MLDGELVFKEDIYVLKVENIVIYDDLDGVKWFLERYGDYFY